MAKDLVINSLQLLEDISFLIRRLLKVLLTKATNELEC